MKGARHLLLLLPILAACVKGEITGAQLDAVRIEAPSAEDCAACHRQQYDEWKKSLHASASVNPRFLDATNDRAFADCLGCHLPETIYTPGAPASRSWRTDEGVTCVSCHLKEGALTGPVTRTGLVKPHATGENDARYRSSELCGKCHEGTYREWTASTLPEKKQCQECHMGEVTRKMTESRDLLSGIIVSFEKEIKQRRHGFAIEEAREVRPPPVELSLVEVRREGGGYRVTIRVENRAPHAIPTGDFGYREGSVEVSLMSGGAVVASFDRRFFKETGTAVASGKARLFEGRLEGEGDAVEILLSRSGKGGERRVEVARKMEKIQ